MYKTKILVCKGENGYFLRIHLSADKGGCIRFNTEEEFTKREADYRAMILSSNYGFELDELPSYPKVDSYPTVIIKL